MSATGNDHCGRQRPDLPLAEPGIGERFDHVQLTGGTQTGSVHGPMIVGMRTGGHVCDVPLDRELADGGQHGVFAEIAAVARIRAIAGNLELGDPDFDQLRAEIGGDLPRVNEFGTGEAGRVGDHRQHSVGRQRSQGRGQHEGGVNSTGKPNGHTVK